MSTPVLSNGFAMSRHHESAEWVSRQVAEVGHARLRGVVDESWLRAAHEFATANNRPDCHDVLVEDLTPASGPHVDALLSDRTLADFLATVATRLHPGSDPEDRHLDVSMRIVNGPDRSGRSLWFHYDATVLTAVFPVDIPDGGPGHSGELVLHANRRPFRRFVLTNIVEKMVMQTDTFRRRSARRGIETVLSLAPGDAYVFSGYRSYHATLPVPEGSRRVTLLVHYREAHSGSRLLRNAVAAYHRFVFDGSPQEN